MARSPFKARNGIRVTGQRSGSGPKALFIDMKRGPKANFSDESVLHPSGGVSLSFDEDRSDLYDHPSPVIASSSIRLQTSVTAGRRYESLKNDAIILGRQRSSVDALPFPSPIVMDVVQTGTFESPSWTRASIGVQSGFVIPALSSSDSSIANSFLSGRDILENSPSPATSPIHMSKLDRFKTITVKLTGSQADTVSRGSGSFVPAQFFPGTGTLVNVVTGTNVPPSSGTIYNPATFFLPVPVQGRLVDIMVWVEIVQSSGSSVTFPLGCLGVAVRSPSLRWGNAHPLRNDPEFKSAPAAFKSLAVANGLGNFYDPIPDFHRDSFILWEGPGSVILDNALQFPFSDLSPSELLTV